MTRRKMVNKLLMISIIVVAISGFLIRPMEGQMIIVAIHKLSAVIFCVLGVLHVLQYKKRN